MKSYAIGLLEKYRWLFKLTWNYLNFKNEQKNIWTNEDTSEQVSQIQNKNVIQIKIASVTDLVWILLGVQLRVHYEW